MRRFFDKKQIHLIGAICLLWTGAPRLWAQHVIEGTYDAKYKQFIPHVNLLNHGLDPTYEVGTMVHGYGVIEDRSKRSGVIDSTGAVVVPLVYDRLDECRNQPGAFIFLRGNTIGIIARHSNEQCTLSAQGNGGIRNVIYQTKFPGFFYFEKNGKMGLFDASRSKILIPAEYDKANHLNETIEKSRRQHAWIYLNDSIAMARKQDSLFVFNLENGERSKPYRDVVMLSTGSFFLKSFNDFVAVSGSYMDPVNALPYRVLDTYNDYVLGRNAVGYGITDAKGEVVIPFIYEDLFFLNKDALWLKQNGLWALANYQHQLLSPFEFMDIDQCNQWFVHQLLEVTKLDTTGGNLYVEREYAGINDSPTDLKILIYLAQSLEGSKRIYNTLLDYKRCTNRSAARKADGWHFIYPPLGEVEPEAWSDVRYVPNCVDPYGLMSYCKDGKWGLEKDDVRYQYVMYDSMALTINCHNGCLVKNGYIYSYTTNYSINNKGNCYWEKIKKWEEYGVR
jgi:hypothetical protein